jgi:hypothetical protein
LAGSLFPHFENIMPLFLVSLNFIDKLTSQLLNLILFLWR